MVGKIIRYKPKVRHLFVDGTFHNRNIKLNSEEDSVHVLREFLSKSRRSPRIYIGIYHVGTCHLLKQAGLKFKVGDSLSDKNKEAISVMFPEQVDEESRIVLVKPNKQSPLLIPSALWYCCKSKKHIPKDVVVRDRKKQGWRMNFTCHSSFRDNVYLKNLLGASRMTLINDPRTDITC